MVFRLFLRLFVGATRAFARLTQLPATRPPQLAPPIGLSAEQIHHTSCRGLYDSATNGRPSPTRRNTDRLVCRLNRRNIHNILETNVICYSTPMSADLRMSAHDGGAGKGEEIFRFLLDEITPAVLIVHGVGSVKQVSNILNVPLTEGSQVCRRDMRSSNGASFGNPHPEPDPAGVQQVVVMVGWVPGERGRPGKRQTGGLVPPAPAPTPVPARRASTAILMIQAVLGAGVVPPG